MVLFRIAIRPLLCLGVYARSEHTVVTLCVCLSVCLSVPAISVPQVEIK